MITVELQNAAVDLEWGAQKGTLKVGWEMPGLYPAQAVGFHRLCDQARGPTWGGWGFIWIMGTVTPTGNQGCHGASGVGGCSTPHA